MQYHANISNKKHIIIKTLGSNNEPIKKKKSGRRSPAPLYK